MERESFEDEAVADFLNRHFVSLKVDKEERPDIDSVYMNVCQSLTGSGGWPLTILMTPEQKPFFAGTYFPKRRRYGHPGLIELLQAVQEQWETRRDDLAAAGNEIAAAVRNPPSAETKEAVLSRLPAEETAAHLRRLYDREYGGFGRPPKFPMPHNLLFLLRCQYLGIASDAAGMVEHTLMQMIKGGIFDHIGGGFSRYSTDRQWLAPHFEKMLYDNALLTIALLECYQVTANPWCRYAAEQTLSYIEREMTSPEGGFYSAQDADSEGEEGKYYTFTPKEINTVLGPDIGPAFCARYDITAHGNFEGRSIPNLIAHARPDLPDDAIHHMCRQLHLYRVGRTKLHKDDKILTAWNALMIAAYATAYRVLGNDLYLARAERAYRFLQEHMTEPDGKLMVSYRNGTAKGYGLLEDYTYLAWACLELYESTFDTNYLRRACGLMEYTQAHFADNAGGFYLTPHDGEPLLYRPKEAFDGAAPSGNSVAAWCLVRLAKLTGEPNRQIAADRQLAYYCDIFRQSPSSCVFALMALLWQVYPTQELVCAVKDNATGRKLALRLGEEFHPQLTVLVKTEGGDDSLSQIAPFTAPHMIPQGQETAYYLCRGQSCDAPVFTWPDIQKALRMADSEIAGAYDQ